MTSSRPLYFCAVRRLWFTRTRAFREWRSERRCKAGGSASALPSAQAIAGLTGYTRGALVDLIETAKAHFRAKVEHPFRVIKRQFGFQKTRLQGLLLPRPQAEHGGATRSAAE